MMDASDSDGDDDGDAGGIFALPNQRGLGLGIGNDLDWEWEWSRTWQLGGVNRIKCTARCVHRQWPKPRPKPLSGP